MYLFKSHYITKEDSNIRSTKQNGSTKHQKTITKITFVSPSLATIILNVSKLKFPIKDRMAGCIKTKVLWYVA